VCQGKGGGATGKVRNKTRVRRERRRVRRRVKGWEEEIGEERAVSVPGQVVAPQESEEGDRE